MVEKTKEKWKYLRKEINSKDGRENDSWKRIKPSRNGGKVNPNGGRVNRNGGRSVSAQEQRSSMTQGEKKNMDEL